MALGTRTFRIFVSSTFADLKEERNALHERVFPRLKEYCLKEGFRFQAIDLRWGVSEEAARDQQTINICLNEIDRCRRPPLPNFIILLGNRYGWCPPPPQIPKTEFDDILTVVTPGEADVLNEWYKLDRNAVPPEYYLKPRTGAWEAHERWEPKEQELRAILERAAERISGVEHFDRVKYEASATEQEIDRGALRVPEEHAFCYSRAITLDDRPWTDLPDDFFARSPHPLAKDFFNLKPDSTRDAMADQRLERLRGKLRGLLPQIQMRDYYEATWTAARGEDEVPITTDHLDRLCDDVYADLLGVIEREIDEFEQKDRLTREIETHLDFGNERSEFFEGRDLELRQIAQYVAAPGGQPLVVKGEPGSGKSALMARAAADVDGPNDGSVIRRFIGVTPDSSNGRGLLGDLCREMAARWGPSEAEMPIPTDFRELAKHFPERISAAARQGGLVMFLDALDQLSSAEGARSLSWLPTELPPNVAVVVSTTPGDTLQTLESRPNTRFVEVGTMTRDEGGRALRQWLANAMPARDLQEHQRDEVLGKFAVEGKPLFLKLAFEEARRWKSSTGYPEMDLPSSIAELIRKKLFDRLDNDANHGQVMVSRCLGYLAAAKNGLSEDEMIDALSLGGRDGVVIKDFLRRSPKSPVVDHLPVVLWSRLYFDLEPYIMERTADEVSLMTFYHRQLEKAVKDEYLTGQEGADRHGELAAYFGWQRLEIGEQSPKPNLRQMSELPHQQTKGELWDDVVRTLTDFYFLEKKATYAGVIKSTDAEGNEVKTHTGIYQIRDDYALALKEMPGGNGGPGGDDQRRRIIVTGVDFGNGLVLRCPHCNTLHPFQDEWKGDDKFTCPNEACKGPLKVNNFVVPPRP